MLRLLLFSYVNIKIIMSTIPNSISLSLNQVELNNVPQIKLSDTCKKTILSHQLIEFVVNEI